MVSPPWGAGPPLPGQEDGGRGDAVSRSAGSLSAAGVLTAVEGALYRHVAFQVSQDPAAAPYDRGAMERSQEYCTGLSSILCTCRPCPPLDCARLLTNVPDHTSCNRILDYSWALPSRCRLEQVMMPAKHTRDPLQYTQKSVLVLRSRELSRLICSWIYPTAEFPKSLLSPARCGWRLVRRMALPDLDTTNLAAHGLIFGQRWIAVDFNSMVGFAHGACGGVPPGTT